jgi:hypothetical protein
MKRQISWQGRDLNVPSHDLNQLAASQQELPRNRSGTGQTEIINNIGLKLAKGHIQGPSGRRMKDLLKLNRDQLQWVIGLFTGPCHLKVHFFK